MAERPTVTLTEVEQRLARHIAKERNRVNCDAGTANHKVGPQSDEDIDLIGFGAELAFCKLFNLYPDLTLEPRKGGADCERLGESIDVKATRYRNGKLIAQLKKRELSADCYALILVEWPTFTFAGFAHADELFTPDHIDNPGGYADAYVMRQDELHQVQLPWPAGE